MKTRRRPPLPIIYEDDRIVVIDKPAGLLTTSTRLPGRAARAAQATGGDCAAAAFLLAAAVGL